MRRFLLLAMLLASFSGTAESIYRTTDAAGNVVFTDAPDANSRPAQPVEVKPINTVEPPQQLQPLPDVTASAEEQPAPPPYAVTIVAPENETSFPMGPGNFSVIVNVQPDLKKYEGLQLFMDGKPWRGPQRDIIWDLTNVFRGQHDLTVAVVSKAGETLVTSAPVRVYVHRPSTNNK